MKHLLSCVRHFTLLPGIATAFALLWVSLLSLMLFIFFHSTYRRSSVCVTLRVEQFNACSCHTLLHPLPTLSLCLHTRTTLCPYHTCRPFPHHAPPPRLHHTSPYPHTTHPPTPHTHTPGLLTHSTTHCPAEDLLLPFAFSLPPPIFLLTWHTPHTLLTCLPFYRQHTCPFLAGMPELRRWGQTGQTDGWEERAFNFQAV